MLRWAIIFFVIAIVAAIFGFSGIAQDTAYIGKILAVIGPELAEKLFKKENPVGKSLRVDDRDYAITPR